MYYSALFPYLSLNLWMSIPLSYSHFWMPSSLSLLDSLIYLRGGLAW
jgi:hypothetical protein